MQGVVDDPSGSQGRLNLTGQRAAMRANAIRGYWFPTTEIREVIFTEVPAKGVSGSGRVENLNQCIHPHHGSAP